MNERLIEAVVAEIAPHIVGRAFGKFFQFGKLSFAVDFRLRGERFLFISVEPNAPRLYLIKRKQRELEKSSVVPAPFFQLLRKHLGGATLRKIEKDADDRIVRFHFDAADEATGKVRTLILVAQLTGRAANCFLLDETQRIVDSLRHAPDEENSPRGQQIGEVYAPPPKAASTARNISTNSVIDELLASANANDETPLSSALDAHERERAAAREFDARSAASASFLKQEINKRRKLQQNLKRDLATHGDAEAHKRAGDLLLANLSNAVREGERVRVVDYFAEGEPTIEIEVGENVTLQEEAARRFARYQKAKRAAHEINERLQQIAREIGTLERMRIVLAEIVRARDADALSNFEDATRSLAGRKARSMQSNMQASPASHAATRKKKTEEFKGARRYRSTDGYEILVGRAAKDNDYLTFRVARSSDLWLHAADYPGSHVIIRNPSRKEIPQRTILEAAQLAALNSGAKRDSKVAVNYTERRFVSKPKSAAPGLVRLSSFRTVLVEPKESGERI